jgi:hypothetical protein
MLAKHKDILPTFSRQPLKIIGIIRKVKVTKPNLARRFDADVRVEDTDVTFWCRLSH